MIVLHLTTKTFFKIVNLSNLTVLDYEEASGQLLFYFAGEGWPFTVKIKAGTPAENVWAKVRNALSTIYESRNNVGGVQVRLDLSDFHDSDSDNRF
jgi:hypothetical protein